MYRMGQAAKWGRSTLCCSLDRATDDTGGAENSLRPLCRLGIHLLTTDGVSPSIKHYADRPASLPSMLPLPLAVVSLFHGVPSMGSK